MRRTPALLALLLVTLFVFAAGAAEPIPPRAIRHHVEREAGPVATRYVIAAAGDIACDHAAYDRRAPNLCQYDDTARLIDGDDLSAVLLLGDNQYERGAYRAYLAFFDPTWGRAFDTLAPAPGNHESATIPRPGRAATSATSATRRRDRTGSGTTRSTSGRAPTPRAGT